ncbi:hypothetical protein [Nitrosomonas sp. Nm132]|jgi:hypothetical protein|uniref:hypothetical protein n=1 Tax=Nitrosomonas sp. Nm132 TaxID=1881053 RepID=UPI000886176A|nr:hypothetical protein [Nitrosomonas sp. Nm132]SDI01814.1 hypothetical protein SAMN05428952_10602 [Nitrosomonas sp. Nm132]
MILNNNAHCIDKEWIQTLFFKKLLALFKVLVTFLQIKILLARKESFMVFFQKLHIQDSTGQERNSFHTNASVQCDVPQAMRKSDCKFS